MFLDFYLSFAEMPADAKLFISLVAGNDALKAPEKILFLSETVKLFQSFKKRFFV